MCRFFNGIIASVIRHLIKYPFPIWDKLIFFIYLSKKKDMAAPGAGVGAAVIQTPSLTPLVERVSNQLDLRARRDRAEKEAINQQFAEEISSIDYNGLTTDQIDGLRGRTEALVDLNANMIRTAGGDPRQIDRKLILREQNSIRAQGDKWRQFGQEISSVSKAIDLDKDKIYDKEAMNNAMVSMTWEKGPDGERRARSDVQTGDAMALLDNPAFMDPDQYFKREIMKLEEITTKEFETGSFPGFGTIGMTMQQTTRVPWVLDPNGQPHINPDTGEKVLDLDNFAQMVLDDPNTRKHIQHFAASEGLTVNEYLHRKALEHNATPKTLEQVHLPRMLSSSARRGREKDDVKRVFLDTVSGLINQSPELVQDLPQADENDEDGVPYRDATEILSPYALTKVNGKALPFAKVYIKDGEPGTFYVKDTEDAEPRPVSEAEVTNIVNAAGTLNTALRGIDSYAVRRGYVTGQNVFNPNVNIQKDPGFLGSRQQLRQETIQTRQQSQAKLKEIAGNVRDQNWWKSMGTQSEFNKEINTALQGKTIRIKGFYDETIIVTDTTVETSVNLWEKNEITIKDGEEVKTTLTAQEFADLIESPNFIVKEAGATQATEPEPEPEPEPVVEEKKFIFDEIGQ